VLSMNGRMASFGALFVMFLCLLQTVAYAQADDHLLARAEAGDSAAQFELGNRYLNADAAGQDVSEALPWFLRAAEGGNFNAQYNIAVMYLNGLGVAKDETKAVEWFVSAANNGDPQSQFTLAMLLFNGQAGLQQNVAEAYQWFILAGAGGHQAAAANAVLVQELLAPAEVMARQQTALQWIEAFSAGPTPDSNE